MRSADELQRDARASPFFAENGSLILFGRLVREIVPGPDGTVVLRWDDGTEIDFPDWLTAIAMIWDSVGDVVEGTN